MGQFPAGIPYVAGQQSLGQGQTVRTQQPLIRLVASAANFSRYDGVNGQALLFGPIKGGSNLLYARVIGPFGSSAFLYVGQGDLAAVIQAPNLESSTVSGNQDEASWERPGIPIYDQWSVAVFWNRTVSWGQATAKIYYEQVAS